MTGDQNPDPDLPPITLDPGVEALLRDPATWVEPDAALGDRVVAAVTSEATSPFAVSDGRSARRGRGLRPVMLGAAAAVVVLFGAVVVLSALSSGEVEEAATFELVPTGLAPDAAGEIEIVSTESGLRIDLDAVGLPRRDGGAYYEGWVVADSGPWIPIGTFHEGEDVILWAGIGPADVREFTITLEEAGPGRSTDHDSSGDVVLKADLFLD